MEENSESNAKANVPSSTTDVPESHEVTGSHGNVETVIVVEKLEEEQVYEVNSNTKDNQEQEAPTHGDGQTTKLNYTKLDEPIKVIENAPENDVQAQFSVQSPNKDVQTKEPTEESPTKESPLRMSIDEELNKTAETSCLAIPVDGINEKEASNDSQIDTSSDTSEKDHNKSISRELKSLINSAKESKIISECTQLTSKTRKSRNPLDNSNTSLNSYVEANKIQGNRRSSNISQKSNSSEKSEKTSSKRTMRSQNPDFVNRVKQFLNSVTGKVQKSDTERNILSDENLNESKTKSNQSDSTSSTPKKKKQFEEQVEEKSNRLNSDPYCWRCHWSVEQAANDKMQPPKQCTVCPRSYHFKCLSGVERSKINTDKNWVCPDCMIVLHAESSETRSPAMKKISLGMLCELLKYALKRMMDLNGVEPFLHPVDRAAFPDYGKYVVHPMDLTLMKENIAEGLYGSTEAFLADAQWILHNSIIFNTLQSKLTAAARALVRSCRTEMGEIEACPECYAAAHARRPTWFTDVCSTPHVLLWAKLKGFPYWPAKGMSVSNAGLVDVRFFGAHDRAWVPARDCFLYSEKDPNNFRTKRQDIMDSMLEAEQHIRNISRKYGKFVYPPFKTQFDPTKLSEQLKMMIPSFEGEVRNLIKDKSLTTSPSMGKDKQRSNSKSSKDSLNDGYMSEGEDAPVRSRIMADGAEIAREEDSLLADKDNTDMDVSESKENGNSRKRRRSELEEAVITIIDSSSAEKRKRVDNADVTEVKKSDSPEKSGTVLDEAVSTIMDSCTDDKSKQNKDETKVQENKKFETEKMNNSKPIQERVIEQDEKPKPEVPEINSKTDLNAPSSGTVKKDESALKVTPIKIVITPKINKQITASKANTPKDGTEKTVSQKQPAKREKSASNERNKSHTQNEKLKSQKRRKSESNRSFSNTAKGDRNLAKKINNSMDGSSLTSKDRPKENNGTIKINNSIDINKPVSEKNTSTFKGNSSKSPNVVKERINFDDDTSLAVIAREVAKNSIVANSVPGLPTISCIRSLSTSQQNPENTATKSAVVSDAVEVTIEANSDSSIFTPTSTDNVRNMKEAVNKLQKLRNDGDQPPVGRVGVRAFARMTSPDRRADAVQVEIKPEPMDYDDPERQIEKLNLMNAFRLQPVNVSNASHLRDVRINKPSPSTNARKTAPKPPECRPRAKKTFPQPKKADDGRSELNSKNSMVYIPIQPAMTLAPVRVSTRPSPAGNGVATTTPAPVSMSSVNTSNTTNMVNTVTTPLIPTSLPTSTATSAASTSNALLPSIPTVGQVPTTVHTVPLITSVNGQWTFSLQPVMSVGGVDSAPSPPMVNGLPERGNQAPALLPPPSSTPSAPTAAMQPITTPATPITPNRTTNSNNPPGEPPRLQQRPVLLSPLDANTPVSGVPAPSAAGPLTAKLNQNAVKLTDFFRTLLEDSLEKLDEPVTQVTTLRLQLEQLRWRHQQELEEIKHNHELVVAEMRASFEKEKTRVVSEARRVAQLELDAAVKLAKSKQWCANCNQEAQFYCCWNTSYCDYACQRAHWSQHFSSCTQRRTQDGNGNDNAPSASENRLQSPPNNLPISTSTPTLTVGGKATPSRVYNLEQASQKPSIIVSMVEDSSGNQTMKCLGSYKPAATTQTTPLILNKQLMNNEDNANKKVVTSGGYLIVGAGAASNAPLVASARHGHTIQYYT